MNNKKMQMVKTLQESMKLDRAGIRLGWNESQKKDMPILKMEFTIEEAEALLYALTYNDRHPESPLYQRVLNCYAMMTKCLKEVNSG